MSGLEKTDKEQASLVIFGVGRGDGCVLNSLTNAQKTAISQTLALTDHVDTIYDQHDSWGQFAGAFNIANEQYKTIVPTLPDKDIRTVLLGTTLKAYEHLGALITASIFISLNENVTAIAATARMRKLF